MTLSSLHKNYFIITYTIFYLNRDIYYTDPQLFGNQSIVDNIVNDISCMLKIPRRSLHIVSLFIVSVLQSLISLFKKLKK